VQNCDYINNLAPKSEFTKIYSSLEQFFIQALHQLESVYNYRFYMHIRLCFYQGSDNNVYDTWLSPFRLLRSNDEQYSFKGQRLQVNTKIVDYELGPFETNEGVWHID
jgi:hypothetical protein